MKRSVSLILVLLLSLSCLGLSAGTAAAADPGTIYRVRTDDGAEIVMVRYRPNTASPFNEGAQPVIMMAAAAVNLYEYALSTPEGCPCYAQLPGELPDWAVGDEEIARDPVKLYSMGYYLYSQGYDVYLTNYRGQGRGETEAYGYSNACIDTFGIYDVKAAVKKVRALTGQKPVYLGHSMGSTMAYVYLQGSYYVPSWNFDVASDPALAAMRNDGSGDEAIKGWVNLDGPLHPKVTGGLTPTGLVWFAFFVPLYLNLRIVGALMPRNVGVGPAANLVMQFVWNLRNAIPDPLDDIVTALFSINPANMDPHVLDQFIDEAVDGGMFHMIAQYFDASECGELREYYRNGLWGRFRIFPPPLNGPEGLYSYSANMKKVTLPTLILADATLDITDPAHLRECMDLKTHHPLDEYHVIPNTAHMDLINGLNAPYETYPRIGAWIERVCAQ